MAAEMVVLVTAKMIAVVEADELLGFRALVQDQPTSARLAGPSVFSSAP